MAEENAQNPMPEKTTTSEAPPASKSAPARGKKTWKSVTFAKVFIQSSFNNTIVSITDDRGNVIAWASGIPDLKVRKRGRLSPRR